jgi:hypothetical protein
MPTHYRQISVESIRQVLAGAGLAMSFRCRRLPLVSPEVPQAMRVKHNAPADPGREVPTCQTRRNTRKADKRRRTVASAR